MPTDKSGKFHLNTQRAQAADKAAKPKAATKEPVEPSAGKTESQGSNSTTLHDHGDGSFHTESSDGAKEEHPTIGHALMHMAGKHSEGTHMHMHDGGGMGHVSHHTSGGAVEGPNEHGSADEMAEHAKGVFGGGGQQGGMQPEIGGSHMTQLSGI